jgi:large subunit ribosomal protein L22
MPGLKTNEIEGTRAVLRYSRMSAYKVREVLDLIRGQDLVRAAEILRFSERDAAIPVAKLLASAVANAQHNDEMDPDELYVSTCYADEGATIKRWRPRARGRATRIRKRTCHVTVIVSRLPEDRLARMRAQQAADLAERRARRVAGQRQAEARRRRRGGAGGAGEEEVSDQVGGAAEAAEEAGIVDQQAPAVEAAETGAAEPAGSEESAGAAEAASGIREEGAEAAGEAGIVDQQAPAVEAAQAEAPEETTEEEGS